MALKNIKTGSCSTVAVILLAFFIAGALCSPSADLNAEKRKHAKGRDGLAAPVTLVVRDDSVMMDNGLVRVGWSNPEGTVELIQYGGMSNVLDYRQKVGRRGYWDSVFNGRSAGDAKINYQVFIGDRFRVIKEDPDETEISFTSFENELAIDLRYVMRRGVSGYYSYTIVKHNPESGPVDIGQLRAAFKLDGNKFHYMAVSDKVQRLMPSNCDRLADRSSSLAYGEAVLIDRPCENFISKGEVDDKYFYSIENKDNKVHGWISENPGIGFWLITPSSEFRTGGPFKQNLASHTGPTCLAALYTDHYIGKDVTMRIEHGEDWKMVYGPFLVYLNSAPASKYLYKTLWAEAKDQLHKEEQSWPYNFLQSEDYVKPAQRGSVTGQLEVYDRYNSTKTQVGSYAWVGLAAPGEKGSWQMDTKGYQFWIQADKNGYFEIKGVVPGVYNLFATVPGVIDEYKYTTNVVVESGSKIDVGRLVYEPPRSGPTLWEIGTPDRTAAEFFIPDPNPNMVNMPFLHDAKNRYRQYGLWLRYANLYPRDTDLVYNTVTSDYAKDWFYAHVTRKVGDNTYEGTTRQIQFPLAQVMPNSVYTLQVALASSNYAELQVRVNDRDMVRPVFRTGMFGKDNAIARHGIHGIYKLFSIPIDSYLLHPGMNMIYLTQPRNSGAFAGLLYDYIRLEGPSRR